MKYFLIIISLILFRLNTYSQNQVTPVSTHNNSVTNYKIQPYNSYDSLILINDFVNLRSGPSIDSPVVANLRINTPIKSLKQRVRIPSSEKRVYWTKVKTSNQEGYIHSSLLMFPRFKTQSLTDSTVYFLQSIDKLAVFRKDSIIHIYDNHIGIISEMYSLNTQGIPDLEVILVQHDEPYCGGYSGKSYFCWNGKSLIRCGGDGDYGETYTGGSNGTWFPSNKNNNTPFIIHTNTSYISPTLPNIELLPFSPNIITEYSLKIEKYNGDQLENVTDSVYKTTALCQLMNTQFNSKQPPHLYIENDFNGDDSKDLVFIQEGVYFAFADSIGQLHITNSNTSLFKRSKYIDVEKFNQGIAINLIRSHRESEWLFRRIEFQYDFDLKQLIVTRTIDVNLDDEFTRFPDSPPVVKNFKTNKISLEEIW